MPNIYIVNHPSQEPTYINKHVSAVNPIDWNTSKHHKRKFIKREGLYLDSNNHLIKDTLYFWGEYEPYSDATIVNNTIPRAIHTNLKPVMKLLPTFNDVKNTDPYVYGCFRNICCGRRKTNYNRGDIILFGNVKNRRIIEIDTVIVVDKTILVNILSTTSQYYLASADLKFGITNEDFIEGLMYIPGIEHFSYVPCLPAGKVSTNGLNKDSMAAITYRKPTLDLSILGNIDGINGRGSGWIPSSKLKCTNPWLVIKDAVTKDQNAELGVYVQPI